MAYLALAFPSLWIGSVFAAPPPAAAAGADPPADKQPESADDDVDNAAEVKPWAKGVSGAEKERAEALLGEGNKLFLDAKHAEALKKYRTALAAWDHPAIRFNIARALIILDKPVEAYGNIEKALKYGQPPLGKLFDEAQNYQRLLKNQIATLQVKCAQDGVTVTVDGKPFFTCPGERSVRVLPGAHQVVGKKAGYLTFTKEAVVLSGASNPVELQLVSHEDATVAVQYFDDWIPWTVVAGGAAVGVVGVLLELQARASHSQYADLVASNCSAAPCAADFGAPTLDRANLEHGFGLSAMIVGGTALAVGITGVILNRPRTVLQDPQADPLIVPLASTQGGGLAVVGTF